MKILNLFAGIGGNRESWSGHEITAVEYDCAIAKVYQQRFPNDKVITTDAVGYVELHYNEYDFIWASPPCPTHGQYRHTIGVKAKGFRPCIPKMTSLYGVIVFLRTYFKGKWVVENVIPYYGPLIEPEVKLQRHLFWSNFHIPKKDFEYSNIAYKNQIDNWANHELVRGSDISDKIQVLRNCVLPEVGAHILEAATTKHKMVSRHTQSMIIDGRI